MAGTEVGNIPPVNNGSVYNTEAYKGAAGNIGYLPGATSGAVQILDPSKATMYDYYLMGQYNKQFETPYMDYAKMGIGGLDAIAGLIGTGDTLRTNKLNRQATAQNLDFARQEQAARNEFRAATKSAFA
jgi:hypothetical protein